MTLTFTLVRIKMLRFEIAFVWQSFMFAVERFLADLFLVHSYSTILFSFPKTSNLIFAFYFHDC